MSTPGNRLPVSTTNAVLVGVFLLGALGTGVAGSWPQAVLLGLVGLAGFASALFARRASSSDITRVNAIEYRDERDKQIARTGFAVVGVVALIVSVAAFVVVSVLPGPYGWIPTAESFLVGQMLLLAMVWAVANSVAARRS